MNSIVPIIVIYNYSLVIYDGANDNSDKKGY
jgi:hypothetical protein